MREVGADVRVWYNRCGKSGLMSGFGGINDHRYMSTVTVIVRANYNVRGGCRACAVPRDRIVFGFIIN